jgi:hypothetical protein
LEFLIENIFVEFGGHIFQQIICNHIGTSCALLLVDLSAHYYKLIQKLIKDKQYTEAKAFNLYFGYIDTALSITKWIQLIYTKELEKQLPLSHV